MIWDLKLASGKVVQWEGDTGEDAARRFVDSERVAGRPDVAVVASRRPSSSGIYVLGRGRIDG